MELMRVTAVDYTTEDGETLLQLAGRAVDGSRVTKVVEGTRPHFYVRDDAKLPDDGAILDAYPGFGSYDGVPLARVETRKPDDTTDYTDDFETWESDIPFYRRATMDYNLVGYIRVPQGDRVRIENVDTDPDVPASQQIEPRILIGDIEVLQGGSSIEQMKQEGDNTVTHATFWDSQTDEYVCLYLDPESQVNASEVEAELEVHSAAESLSRERDRPIHLRRYETESALAEGLLSLFEDRRPDLVSGWNWVDFDWTYLLNWFENFDVNEHRLSDIGYINGYQTARKVDCVPAFDMMSARTEAPYSFSNWRSSSLDYVAKEDLGVGKIPDVDINWAYARDRSRLTAYNIMDVMLTVGIERKEDLHAFFYELAEIAQVQVYDTNHEMRLVDGYIMSNSDDDEKLPPMPDDADIPENAGGLVLNPSDGIKEWVGVHDLKSLYPSAIITWNISPETIRWHEDGSPAGPHYLNVPWMPDADEADGGNIAESDIDFDVMWTDMRQEGLIPKYLKQLFPERAKFKRLRDEHEPGSSEYEMYDRRQRAVKVIMNSFYGVSSNDYWRLGKYGLGDAITSAARYTLWKGKQIAEDEGLDVIYGDTDSIMVSLAPGGDNREMALDRGHDLEDTLNGRMAEAVHASGMPDDAEHPFIADDLHGTDQHCLVYEFEKLFRRFFQAGSKKRYAGLTVWKEGKDIDRKISTTGFESQRSDSPEITSEVQPEVIERILDGQEFDEISEYLQGLIDDIESREIPLYRVALPGVVNKPLHEYGNRQVPRACRYANEHLDETWSQGDDPWVYFIESTPTMESSTDVLALDWGDDLPDGFELDLDATLERALKGPLGPILDEMGWRWTEVKEGAQTGSAADDGWAGGDWETTDSEDDDTEEVVW